MCSHLARALSTELFCVLSSRSPAGPGRLAASHIRKDFRLYLLTLHNTLCHSILPVQHLHR